MLIRLEKIPSGNWVDGTLSEKTGICRRPAVGAWRMVTVGTSRISLSRSAALRG